MRNHLRKLTMCCWCALSAILSATGSAEPPKVVKAIPDNGDIGVDPNLREIRITFDQAMSHGGHSVVGGGESFPELLGQNPGKWRGSRTFSLRVRLKPNHNYWLSINSHKFQKFKNPKGEPAVPYPIQFKSGAGDEQGQRNDEQTAKNKAAIDQLKDALATQYSFRDRLGIDWAALIEANRKPLEAAGDPVEFARLASTLLSKAQDKHLWLKHGNETIPSYINPVTPNVNFKQLPQVIPDWKQLSPVLATGQWEDGIAYVWIGTWAHDRIPQLAPIFDVLEQFKDAPALIIDVRGNGGGDERIAQSVAGCFIDKPVVYAKQVIVDADEPSGFSAPYERVLTPNKKRTAYRGKIAVLSGPVVISSCEAFLLMMKQVPDAVLVGAPSQGSSGNPQPVELDNGVTVFLPCWKAMTPAGVEFEGIGISPDLPVVASRADFEETDPVIDAALAHLRSQLARNP